jgi:hypothetical protein
MKSEKTTEQIEKLIKECGKSYVEYTDLLGIEHTKPKYCGYYNYGCDVCHERQWSFRAMLVRRNLENARQLFRCVINDDIDWARLSKKIRRSKINFMRVPQTDGMSIIVTEEDPDHSDFCFVEVDVQQQIRELVEKENIFTVRKRTSSREWNLTKSKKEDDSNGIKIIVFYPVFKIPNGERFNVRLANKMRWFASTWPHGAVNLDNLQEYVKYKKNKFIELMAECAGYVLDIDASYIKEEEFTENQISKWFVNDNRNHMTNKDVLDDGFDTELYSLAMGITDPVDYMAIKVGQLGREQLGDLVEVFYSDEELAQERELQAAIEDYNNELTAQGIPF